MMLLLCILYRYTILANYISPTTFIITNLSLFLNQGGNAFRKKMSRWVVYGSLVATGNTTRGAIFALFEMAEVVLGVVDPWWRFTMNTPPYLGQINISTSFASIHPPPAFRYRGFFTNDKLHQPPTRPCALH